MEREKEEGGMLEVVFQPKQDQPLQAPTDFPATTTAPLNYELTQSHPSLSGFRQDALLPEQEKLLRHSVTRGQAPYSELLETNHRWMPLGPAEPVARSAIQALQL